MYFVGQLEMEVRQLLAQVRRGLPDLSQALGTLQNKKEKFKEHVINVKAEMTSTFERYFNIMCC